MAPFDIKCADCSHTDCLIKKYHAVEEAQAVLSKKRTFSCQKGQSFILEGAPVHGLYFVYKGKVKVSKTGLNGREQIVRLVGEGEIIGHRGFGTSESYEINAVALETTTLCNFSSSDFHELLQAVPELTYDLMIFYAEELNRTESKIKKFAQMTVREKVIDALLYLNRKFGQTNKYLNILLSRKEIADLAGTTDEQVIRILSSLKKEELIEAKGKRISILNAELLRKEISAHNYFLSS